MKRIHTITCLLLTLVFSSGMATPQQQTDEDDIHTSSVPDCNLQTTPLTKCDLYNGYILADKELNKRYKLLINKLNYRSVHTLRETQRQWLKFREKRCEELQIAAECESPICRGVEHDMCVLELTTNRAKELENFATNPQSALIHNFSYNSIYPKPLQGE